MKRTPYTRHDLICPHCGGRYKSYAPRCPYCSFVIVRNAPPEKRLPTQKTFSARAENSGDTK